MADQRRAVVCGAGGFIGGHLVRHLKQIGYWVRGVDQHWPEFGDSAADEFLICDLRGKKECMQAVAPSAGGPLDEVYQLAADMGGMGFIHAFPAEIMHNNALINIHMVDATAIAGIARYFFASSACVYRDMEPGEPELTEADVLPARPDNDYGWEKLYAERVALAYARRYGMAVRIARFQNCYGPLGTWTGGREKAPAALCRKVAEASVGGAIEIWGDGTAVRSYIHVLDMVDAIVRLMSSNLECPVNIGTPEYVTVQDLARTVMNVAEKQLEIRYVDGPVGVRSRNFSNEMIFSTGWRPKFSLEAGIGDTYPWIADQVRSACSSQAALRSVEEALRATPLADVARLVDVGNAAAQSRTSVQEPQPSDFVIEAGRRN